MLIRILKPIRRTIVSLAVLILVLAALVASLGRYFVPYLSDYQEPVIAWINEATPFDLSAKTLNGSWRRLSPTIKVGELQLGSLDDGLYIDRARVTLNLAASLWHRKLVFDQLEFSGTSLDLLEDSDGRWTLAADWLPEDRPPTKLISLDSFYSGLDRLLVRAARVTLHRQDGKEIVVDHLNIDYTKQGNEWRIKSSGLPDRSPLPLNMVVEGIGLPTQDNFSARAYSLVNGFDVSPYLSRAKYRQWAAELPRIDGELWLDFHRNGRVLLQGKLDLRDIKFNHDDGRQSIDVPRLQTQFKFALGQSGTPSVWLRDLSIQLSDEVISFEQANLLPSETGLLASFDSIEVHPVLGLLRRFEILPTKAQEALAILDPGGELHDIVLAIPEGAELAQMQLVAGLRNVDLKPWKGAPGVDNLSGNLFAQSGRGLVDIKSEDIALHFPKLFHQSLDFALGSGPVEWVIHEKTVEVRSGKIQFSGKLGDASAFLKLDLPYKKEPGLNPEMDLQIALEDTLGRHRVRFIPYTLDKGLQDWLERSVLKATVDEAALIYRGALSNSAANERTVQLFLDANGAEVDYAPAWPTARNVTAQIFIDDNKVLAEASKGKISGLALNNTQIRYVPEKAAGGGRLKLKADISGKVEDGMDFLHDSPIEKQLKGALDGWHASGGLSGNVRATIPIGLSLAEDVELRSRLHGAEFSNQSLDLSFKDLNGPLRYSSKRGLHSAGLVGTFWEGAIAAEIGSKFIPDAQGEEKESMQINVNAQGNSSGAKVLDWLRLPLHSLVDGEFDYNAELSIGGGDSQLRVRTDFAGMESRLPAPFAKKAPQTMATDVRLFLNNTPLRMRVHMDNNVNAALVLSESSPITGTVSFGGSSLPDYADDSIRLLGELQLFELQPWLDFVEACSSEFEGDGSSVARLPAVYAQRLTLKRALAFDNEFHDLVAAVASHQGAWTFAVNGKDISGRATYDTKRSLALDVSLDHLYLQTETDELGAHNDEGEPVDLLADWYPSDIPEMQFKLADLRVDGEPYGRWSFQTAEIQHGVIFRDLDASSRGLQIAGTAEQGAYLRWRRVGDQQQTEFNGVLSCGDLASVLAAWDYAPAISSKSCRFGTALSWFGSPLDLQLAQMEGTVNIALNNGQFLETNSTANALRLFSLFNFDTLLRRLQFRFDDVFNRGLSFDRITGEFALANGQLDIEQAFDVKGPSSRLQMTGSLDLVNETVDTRMVATLPISSNLPWVAALAGGLPMAAGVYVAGKIFQKPMEKLSSASYDVTGSWDDPEIKLQRIFDDDAKKGSVQSSRSKANPAAPP